MKFKIWDNEMNCYVPVTGMMRDDGEIFIEAKPQEWANISEYPGRFVVCFSSGFGDDNGRELFHGDIVGLNAGHEYKDYNGIAWLNWGADMAWVCSQRLDYDFGMPINWPAFTEHVYLGNIFQNRGLVDREPPKDSKGMDHALPF